MRSIMFQPLGNLLEVIGHAMVECLVVGATSKVSGSAVLAFTRSDSTWPRPVMAWCVRSYFNCASVGN
jgi:hypothetical protein